MSSPERKSRFPGFAVAAACLVTTGLAATSACTVRPLYTDGAANPAVTGSIGGELSSIAIKPVTNRVGQQVRNNLIFLFYGGAAEPAAPRYTLTVAAVASSESSANIQINKVNEPTAAIETVRAAYKLTDSSGAVVASGSRQFAASYDVPRQEFAALRAKLDAENRASRELAELLRLAIAQDLSHRPAS